MLNNGTNSLLSRVLLPQLSSITEKHQHFASSCWLYKLSHCTGCCRSYTVWITVGWRTTWRLWLKIDLHGWPMTWTERYGLCPRLLYDEVWMLRWKRGGRGWRAEWLPAVKLSDESRTGILFCQLECANGNVRAPWKLMNLMGEMPPLWANAWSIAIVFSERWCFCLLFIYLFLLFFFFRLPMPGLAAPRIRGWWWTFESRK